MRRNNFFALLAVSILGFFAAPHLVWAQSVPRSFAASPNIYKVIAENEQYRIVAATWKPGERDAWHSHGSVVAVYYVTDCNMSVHTPDGKTGNPSIVGNTGRVGSQPPSHSLENIGNSECSMILFESK